MATDTECDPKGTDVVSPRVPLVAIGVLGLMIAALAFLELSRELKAIQPER